MSNLMKKVLAAICLSLVSIIVLSGIFKYSSQWRWDPSYYYAQLRSPLIDHDLDISQEIVPIRNSGSRSAWPVGPGLLWAPFFVAAHIVVLLIEPAKANGLTFPYLVMVSVGSTLFGLLGLWLIYKSCRFFGGWKLALATTALCALATPVIYYVFRQSLMAHSTGLFASALMLVCYLYIRRDPDLKRSSGLLFGVVGGVNFLTRWSGILIMILPLLYYAEWLIRRWKVKDISEFKAGVKQIAIMGVAFLITISPQIAFWIRVYGSPLVSPQNPSTFVQSFLPIHALDVIFHSNRGLIYWMPFVLLCLLGVPRMPDKILRWSTLLIVFLLIVTIGYRVDWYSGGGFGARYFIEALPILAVCFVCAWVKPVGTRIGKVVFGLIALALVLHQAVLMTSFEHGLLVEGYGIGAPLGLRWQVERASEIMTKPGILIEPSFDGGAEQQSIVINLIHGESSLTAYRFSASSVLVISALIGFLFLLISLSKRHYLVSAAWGLMAYSGIWFIFLMQL